MALVTTDAGSVADPARAAGLAPPCVSAIMMKMAWPDWENDSQIIAAMKNTETKETPMTSPGRVPKNSETTKPAPAFTACLKIKGKVGSAFKHVQGWNKEVAARSYLALKYIF